jgi:hypothetical protein
MPSQRQVVRYPLWLTAGIGGVVLLCNFTAFQSYRTAEADARAYHDPYMINAQQERLREAIPYLPEHAEMGYLSDVSFEEASGSAAYFGVCMRWRRVW